METNSYPYRRVIPRDFFNESKLLKCMGQLSVKIHDGHLPEGITITIVDIAAPFQVEQQPCAGLTVTNYPVFVNGVQVTMISRYNSKDNYPLFCEDWAGDEYRVFDENGDWTQDFINQFSQI